MKKSAHPSLLEFRKNPDFHLKKIYKETRSEAIRFLQKRQSISREEAIEIFQKSVVTLYEKLCLDANVELHTHINGLLYGIMKNNLKEHVRNNGRHYDPKKLHIESDIDEKKLKESRFSKIQGAIEGLNPKSRKVLRLFYFQHKSIPEITEIMGYKNTDTTKNMKYKSLSALKQIMAANSLMESAI